MVWPAAGADEDKVRIERSIEIVAPSEKVWSFLVEPEKILKWWIALGRFEYTGEQRDGVGTSFYIEEKVTGRLVRLNFRVTEWLRNKRLAFEMTSGDFVKAYEQVWTIESTPSGSRFTLSQEFELLYGIAGKLLEPFARRQSEDLIERMLLNLKRLVEAS